MNDIVLKPYYVAFVSGGKDSLYMLQVILNNLHKYPLNCVCHFELEIDFPFVKDVINKMKSMCEHLGIKFLTFKPRISWFDLVEKYFMPTRLARWCNSSYKLDCQKQLDEYLNSIGCYCVKYIGFCYDEEKRFKYQVGSFDYKNDLLCYPLAEEHIYESYILEWAKNVDLFNDYYKYNNRCGCMMCPCSSLMEFSYVYKYYPNEWKRFRYFIEIYEKKFNRNWYGYYNINELENIIEKKYFNRFYYQYCIFDFL